MQEEPSTLSCQETDRPIWNTMHPTSYILDLTQSLIPPSHRLNDDLRNLLVKTYADVRCIVRKAIKSVFPDSIETFPWSTWNTYIQEGGDLFEV